MENRKVYCCVPTYLKDDEKVLYEVESTKNYYLATFPEQKDHVEFVTNYIENRRSRDYSLSDKERKDALVEELSEAIKRLQNVDTVVFYPGYDIDAGGKAIEILCSSYECKTQMIKMSR